MPDFILRGAFSDDCDTRRARIDLTTHTLQVIDYEHHEIHSGSFFRVQANDDNTDELIVAFKVEDGTKKTHMVFEWVNEGAGYLQLIEGPTWTTGTGSDITVKNSRRDSTKTSILQGDATGTFANGNVTINPTGFTGGSVISDNREYTTAKAGGSSGFRASEIILKNNEIYAFVWTNTEILPKGVQIRMSWYEQTDKS